MAAPDISALNEPIETLPSIWPELSNFSNFLNDFFKIFIIDTQFNITTDMEKQVLTTPIVLFFLY